MRGFRSKAFAYRGGHAALIGDGLGEVLPDQTQFTINESGGLVLSTLAQLQEPFTLLSDGTIQRIA